MKTFCIEYEFEHRRYETNVEAWSEEHAREVFLRDNAKCEIIFVIQK